MMRCHHRSRTSHPDSGSDVLLSWQVCDRHIRPLSELADSLERNLTELDDTIMALDFDGIVRDNTHERSRPHSVDAICTNGRGLYYIEFKAEREGSMDEICEGYRNKAIESPLICDRFLSTKVEYYRELIIVTQDSRETLAVSLTQNSSRPLPKKWRNWRPMIRAVRSCTTIRSVIGHAGGSSITPTRI